MSQASNSILRLFIVLAALITASILVTLVLFSRHPYGLLVVISVFLVSLPFALLPLVQVHIVLSAARLRGWFSYLFVGTAIGPGILIIGYGPNSGPDFRIEKMLLAMLGAGGIAMIFRLLMNTKAPSSRIHEVEPKARPFHVESQGLPFASEF